MSISITVTASCPTGRSSSNTKHTRPRVSAGAVVNYPNDHPYTRITEFKYLTGQEHPKTTLVYEFPRAEGDPIIRFPVRRMRALQEI